MRRSEWMMIRTVVLSVLGAALATWVITSLDSHVSKQGTVVLLGSSSGTTFVLPRSRAADTAWPSVRTDPHDSNFYYRPKLDREGQVEGLLRCRMTLVEECAWALRRS